MSAAKAALNVMRLLFVIQLAMGIALWMGHMSNLVNVHQALGVIFVFALWLVAILALALSHKRGAAGFALMWGFLTIAFGVAQQNVLPGDFHWVARVAHLVIALAALFMAEDLVRGFPLRHARA